MWGEVPEGTALPLVVVRRTSHNRIDTLEGYSGISISEFVFECWGQRGAAMGAKAQALSIADAVRSAIAAVQSGSLPSQWDLPVSGEDYDEATLEEMEPVAFGFSHS